MNPFKKDDLIVPKSNLIHRLPWVRTVLVVDGDDIRYQGRSEYRTYWTKAEGWRIADPAEVELGRRIDPPEPEPEKPFLRKAPLPDYAGNDIYEGDIIGHPSGDYGIVSFIPNLAPDCQWFVLYAAENGNASTGRLILQVGEKGQAVVLKKDNENDKT